MLERLRTHVLPLVDWLLPPRQSELAVRALHSEDLEKLALHDGVLPYHDEAVRALVWECKYYANPRAAALAGGHLGELLLAAAAEEVGVPLLIPVPMHKKRRRARGHNQTELLCTAALRVLGGGGGEMLASECNATRLAAVSEGASVSPKPPVEYRPKALERVRNTPPQQGLYKHLRSGNVVGSMRADPRVVKGRACIVVDDVETTGATLREARRALKAAGARSVTTLTLARS